MLTIISWREIEEKALLLLVETAYQVAWQKKRCRKSWREEAAELLEILPEETMKNPMLVAATYDQNINQIIR